MKTQNILLAIALGIALAALESAPVKALDTDIYLHTQTTATLGAPNVLIILDNSGSMRDPVASPPAYDSAIDYCGTDLDTKTGVPGAAAAVPANCSTFANRIYYVKGGTATPKLISTNTQWFDPSKNKCFASVSSLDSPGYYTGDYIAYWNTTKWNMLKDGGGVVDSNITYVDCDHDKAITKKNGTIVNVADGALLNDGLSPVASGTTAYTNSGSFSYSTNSGTLSLYTSNYLAYLYNSVLATYSPPRKIDAAKKAVIDLINSNKSVRFGLMIFNVDNTNNSSITCFNSLGCSGGRVIFSVDDMDDQRRTDMANVVNAINAETNTPLSETMYEAYLYYGGKPLFFGNDQYPQSPLRDLTAETFTTQSTAITNGTTTTDSNGNTVYVVPSSETYIAPTEYSCQNANIILVTDGDPTNDTDANSNITKLITGTSKSSCSGVTVKDSSGNTIMVKDSSGNSVPMTASGSDCLDVLAGWMHNNAVQPSISSGGVTTFTVGFGTGLSSGGLALLDHTALYGGTGSAYSATNATELNASLESAIAKIQATTTSFSAPSLAINAFNKQFNNDYIYMSLFFPEKTVAWQGNVKKYRLCTNADITAGRCSALSDVLDVNGKKVTDSSGNFRTDITPQSFWSLSADGSAVSQGGAGEQVKYATRTMYTYYDSSGTYANLTAPSAGGPVSTSSSDTFYAAVTADPTLLGLSAGATSTEVQKLVNWILSQDSYNTSNPTGQRWGFGDPLHSTVTPVTFGKDSSGNPIIKLLVAGNDGVIRMINENTDAVSNKTGGNEEWSFLPQEMYAMQYQLQQNASGPHLFGIDATPAIWVQDVNNDGIIDPATDHVYMYIGMRRGGRNIYAFDLTPNHKLTSLTDKSATPPKLMWVIRGGAGNFAQLGQTWSQPQRVRVRYNCSGSVCDDNNSYTDDSKSRVVLMFAGGYDPHQDTSLPEGPDTMGNAIYMVDPITGSLIWWASSNSSATLPLSQMQYSIPSDLRLIDTDGDGAVDRLYVGDTGGQLWRIDLGTMLAVGSNGGTQGYVFADVGCGSGVKHQSNGSCPSGTYVQDLRKFFYPPDVAPVSDKVYSTSTSYDLVTIGSGDREDPIDLLTSSRAKGSGTQPGNEPVHNRLYAFRDCNYATGAPTTECATVAALTSGTLPQIPLSEQYLFDATSNAIATDTGSALTADISALRAGQGWYINLSALTNTTLPNGLTTTWTGGKVLAPTVIANGILYATTYTPANSTSSAATCQVANGTALEYALNALNATEAPGVTSTSGYRAGAVVVGYGIPSQVVIVYRPDGTTGLIDPGSPVPTAAQGVQKQSLDRNYWFQE